MNSSDKISNNTLSDKHFNVLILGGGIHGVGIAHDLASRGMEKVLLVEKSHLASGTSSKSTKLIHGGLRYLQRLSGFPLVGESLRERKLLMKLAPEITRPMKFCFPVLKGQGYPGFYIRTGLFLYDFLAGKQNIEKHAVFSREELNTEMSMLKTERFSKAFSFWDTQTDDQRLVERVGRSAEQLNANVLCQTKAVKISSHAKGWSVSLLRDDGSQVEVTAKSVVNALGPWANDFLEGNDIAPKFDGVNNKGAHIMVPNLGHKIGAYLQSPKDKRIFFILPWYQYSLIGTTETPFQGAADSMGVSENDIEYILDRCNQYLAKPIDKSKVQSAWAGLRWLAKEKGMGISSNSRSHQMSIHKNQSKDASLYTLYGGKLTSYRSLAQKVGDQICSDFSDLKESQTHLPESWAEADQGPALDGVYGSLLDRFE